MRKFKHLFIAALAVFTFSTEGFSKVNYKKPNWGVGFTSNADLSGRYAWDQLNSVQATFRISSSSPFLFNLGGAYRRVLVGTQALGVHVGGGVSIGTTGAGPDFMMSLSGLGGLSFAIPSLKNILIHADGGPALTVAGGSATFTVAPISTLLGLSIHYIF